MKDKYEDDLENDQGNFYCAEHKKLKKYYIKEKKYFLCEYDGYQYTNGYCHFKDILIEHKEKIEKLKTENLTEITETPENCFLPQKIETDLNKIFLNINLFQNFIEIFLKENFKNLKNFSFSNSEFEKIKDILNNINFKPDGTLNFVNIGVNENNELKLVTLANLLISSEENKSFPDKNLIKNFLEKLVEFQNFLIFFTRTSRDWIKITSKAIFSNLNINYPNLEKDAYNKADFSRKIFFLDELESFLNKNPNFFLKKEENSKMQNLQNKTSELFSNQNLNEKNIQINQINNNQENLINDLNYNIRNKINDISELNLIILNLQKNLDDEKKKNLILLSDNDIINKENLNLIQAFENLSKEYNKAKENFDKINKSIAIQMEEINSIKKRLENELVEERNKNKIFTTENENIKNQIKELQENNNQTIVCQSSNSNEISNLKKNYEEILSDLKETNKNLLEKNSNLENLIYSMEKNPTEKNQSTNEIENSKIQIKNLSSELILLNEKFYSNLKEKEISEKNQNRLQNEVDILEEDIEYRRDILVKYNDLCIELKSSANQNEILIAKIYELEKQLESEENKTDLITNIHNTKHIELRSNLADILEQKDSIESELAEKNKKINILKSENEILKAKLELSINEVNSLKEQIKTIPLLKEKFNNLVAKIEELNSNNQDSERKLKSKQNKIIELNQDIKSLNLKIVENNLIIEKNKENIKSIKNYENKINVFENTRSDLEKLKKKLENANAEDLNFSIRSAVKKNTHSKSLGNSKIKNTDNYTYSTYDLKSTNNKLSTHSTPVDKEEENIIQSQIYNIKPFNYNSLLKDEGEVIFESILSSDSKDESLLNTKNKNLIANWLNYNPSKLDSLKINLLYKAKRDGFKAQDFKSKCYGVKNTLIIVLTQYDKLIGGYTPLSWENPPTLDFSYEEDKTNTSFLFSLTLEERYPIYVQKYAICNTNDLGPVFGGGSDLEIVDECDIKQNTYSGIGHTYLFKRKPEEFYGNVSFVVKDYEVYQVYA